MIENEIRDQVWSDVVSERDRQLQRRPKGEGWTTGHDDEHRSGELAMAAACYALPPHLRRDAGAPPPMWPEEWDEEWWKPKGRRRDLVRAAALLVAEIERLDRMTARQAMRKAREEA